MSDINRFMSDISFSSAHADLHTSQILKSRSHIGQTIGGHGRVKRAYCADSSGGFAIRSYLQRGKVADGMQHGGKRRTLT